MLAQSTTALLEDLRDPTNETVWKEFDGRYRPVLASFGRRVGLDAEDAADAAQEALVQFVRSYRAGKYERGRGRLRSWIIGIARHCILDQQRNQAARREARGMSALITLPDQDSLAEIWEAECDREILRRGVNVLRSETRLDPQTLQAFELLAFPHREMSEVADELNITMNDVYLAKHRCLKRLKPILAALKTAYETD